MNVFLPRPDEIEEVHTHVFTGFADAEQDKIVADAFLRSDPPDDVSKGCEGLDGMLGIVIVPRYSVEPQERKELIAILLQPLFELFCHLAPPGHVLDLPVESIHSRKMPP